MKKLLTIALALAMGVTCVVGLAACGGNRDAQRAESAIAALEDLYSGADVDTPVSYTVCGEVEAGLRNVAVDWSISSDYADYEDYVSVGEKSDGLVTINITQTTEAVEYTLNASVTVGRTTKSTSFNRRIPAEVGGHEPEPPHACESICETCGKCTNDTCEEDVCKNNQCPGHEPEPPHTCESICETCGKCTNNTCEEDVCKNNQCPGHEPEPPHTCESACETCGKCTNTTCEEDVCKNNQCPGHEPETPPHTCESTCETCGKCTNDACEENVCKNNQCPGHEPETPPHTCESTCETCGKCTNTTCEEDVCKNNQCPGHEPETPPHTCESTCETCGKCTNTTCEEDVCKNNQCLGHEPENPDPEEHVHVWEDHRHVANLWTHTMTCNAPGCDLTERETEYCTPVGNKCKYCGYEYQVAEILERLVSGAEMHGTYELTGVITSDITSSNSEGSSDIMFCMDVNGTSIQAYYVTPGAEHAGIKKGDTVTVLGPLTKNNTTLEFNGGTITDLVPAIEHVCEHVCTICGKCASDCTDPVCEEKCPDNHNYGTAQNPLSVEEVLALVANVPENGVTPSIIYVIGVAKNTPNLTGAYYSGLTIVDATDPTKEILVRTVNLGSGVDVPTAGDLLVIYGYVKNYDGELQFAANDGTYVYIAENRGNDVKEVAAVKAEVEAALAQITNRRLTAVDEELTLPLGSNGVSVTWAVTSGTAALVSIDNTNGKLKVVALPDSLDAELTLTATISLNDVSDTTVTLTITIQSTAGDTRDDATKIADALAAIRLSQDTFDDLGELPLPASGEEGEVNFAWEIQEVQGVTDYSALVELSTTGGYKLIIKGLPATGNITVILKVTATITDSIETNNKDFRVTVKQDPAARYGTTNAPLSVAQALALAEEECEADGSYTAQIVYVSGYALSTPASNGTNYSSFNLADNAEATKQIAVNSLLVGSVEAPVQNDILVIYGYIKSDGETIGFAVNDTTTVELHSNTRGRSTITLVNDTVATVSGLGASEVNGSKVQFSVLGVPAGKKAVVKLGDTTLIGDDGNYEFEVAGDATVTITLRDKATGRQTIEVTADNLMASQSGYGSGSGEISGYPFEYIGVGRYNSNGSSYWIQMRTNSSTGTSSFRNLEAFDLPITGVVLNWNTNGHHSNAVERAIIVEFANNPAFDDSEEHLIHAPAGGAATTVTPEQEGYTYVRIKHGGGTGAYLDSVRITGYAPTDEDFVNAVKAEVEAALDRITNRRLTAVDEELTLPLGSNGVSVTWAVTSGTATLVSIDNTNGKLKVVALPDGLDAELTLTATISLNDVSDTTVTLTITIQSTAGDTRDDATKIADALAAIRLSQDTFDDLGELPLPASGEEGEVNFAWEIQEVQGVTDYSALIELSTTNGYKLIIKGLPATGNITVILKVTATITDSTETNNKDFRVTVKQDPAVRYGTANAPLSVAQVLALAEEECEADGSYTAQIVYVSGYALSTPASNGTTYSSFNLADEDDADVTIAVNSLLVGSVEAPVQNDILVIYGYIKSDGEAFEFAVNGTTNVELHSNTRGRSTITLVNDTVATVSGLGASEVNGSKVQFSVSGVPAGKKAVVKLGDTTLIGDDGNYEFEVAGDATVTITLRDKATGTQTILVTADNLMASQSGYGSGSGEVSGYPFEYIGVGRYNSKGSSYWIQMRTNASTGTSSFRNLEEFDLPITGVVLNWNTDNHHSSEIKNAIKVEFANNPAFDDAEEHIIDAPAGGAATTVMPEQEGYTYVRITHNSGGTLYIDSIEITCYAPTDEDIVEGVKEAVEEAIETYNSVFSSTTDFVNLFISDDNASVVWSVKTGDDASYVNIDNETGTLTITKIPDSGTVTLTIIATISRGNVEMTVDTYVITILSEEASATPEAKAAAAIAAIDIKTEFDLDDETYALSNASANGEVTFEWTVQDFVISEGDETVGNIVSIGADMYTLSILKHLDHDVQIKIKVVAKINGVEYANDDFIITVKYDPDLRYGTANAPLTVAQALALAEEECEADGSYTAQIVYVSGYALSTPASNGTTYSSFNLADADATKQIAVNSLTVNEAVIAPVQNDILVIYGYIKSVDEAFEFAVNDTTNVELHSNTRGRSTITVFNETNVTVSGLGTSEVNGSKVQFSVSDVPAGKKAVVKLGDTTLIGDDGNYEFEVAGDATVTITLRDKATGTQTILVTASNLLAGQSGTSYASGIGEVSEEDSDYSYLFSYTNLSKRAWIQMRSNESSGFQNLEDFDLPITKVEVTWNAENQTAVRTDALIVEFANNANFIGAQAVTINALTGGVTSEVVAPDNGEYKYIRISKNCTNALYIDSIEITCREPSEEERIARERAQEAITAVILDKTEYFELGEYELPGEQDDVELSWTVQDYLELVEITADGKLRIKAIPETDTTVTLKVFATNFPACNKDVTITVGEPKSGTYEITADKVADSAGSYAKYTWSTSDANGTISGTLFARIQNDEMQFDSCRTGSYIASDKATRAPIARVIITTNDETAARWQLFTSSAAYTTDANGSGLSTENTASHGAVSGATTTAEWTLSGSDTYFALVLSGDGPSTITSIEIAYGDLDAVPDTRYDITATYDATADRGYAHQASVNGETHRAKDVSITYAKESASTNPSFYTSEIRIYHNGTITVSVPAGYSIKRITLSYTASDGNTVTVDGEAVVNNIWVGSAESVVFTVGGKSNGENGGHIKLTQMMIEYKSPEEECTHAGLSEIGERLADCENPGNEAYWLCSDCGRMFSAETAHDDEEIFIVTQTPANGHTYVTYTPMADGMHHSANCEVCGSAGHIEELHDAEGANGACSKCGATSSVETVVLTADSLGYTTGGYAANAGDHTVNGEIVIYSESAYKSGGIQGQTGNMVLYNKTGFTRIVSIVIVFTSTSGSISLSLSEDNTFGNDPVSVPMSGTYTFTAQSTENYGYFKLSAPTATCKIESITIVYEGLVDAGPGGNAGTPEEKATAAIDAIDLKTEFYLDDETYALPNASDDGEVTFEWTVQDFVTSESDETVGNIISLGADHYTLTILKRLDHDVQIRIKVVAKIDGTEYANDDFIITIKSASSVKSGTYEITADKIAGFSNGYSKYTWSVSDEHGTISGTTYASKSNGIQCNTGKDGAYLASDAPTPAPITKVTIEVNYASNSSAARWKLFTSSAAYTAQDDGSGLSSDGAVNEHDPVSDATTTAEWTVDGNDTYFALVLLGDGASQIKSIKIVYGNPETDPDDDDDDNDDENTNGIWTRVTSADELQDGDQIILVYENYAMSTTQNTNNRGQTSITNNGDTVTGVTEDVEIITLEAIADTNWFALKVTGGYLYAASSSANNMKTQSTINDNASWLITIDGTEATIVAQGSYTRNSLRYNSSSSLFSCYESGQKAVTIYKFVENN